VPAPLLEKAEKALGPDGVKQFKKEVLPKQAEETRGCKRRLSSDIQFLQSIEGLFSHSFFILLFFLSPRNILGQFFY
jgi:hypothetical protein